MEGKLQRHERRVDDKFANSNLAIRRRIPQRPIRCVGVHQLPIPLMSQKTKSTRR